MECLEDVLKIIGGFLTPVIALIAVYIAYQQFRINQRKIKLDLYDKRFKIYLGIKSFIVAFMQTPPEQVHSLMPKYVLFIQDIQGMAFLYPKELKIYVDEIVKKYIHIDVGHITVDEKIEIYTWVENELADFDKRFMPFLDFQNIK